MKTDNTLYQTLADVAARLPDGRALYYKGRYIRYAVMMREIDALAAGLVKRGVRAGDAVTVCMPNVPEAVYALYAINKLGAIAHMVHPLAPAAQLKKFMDKTNSRLLLVLSIALKEYAPLADGVPLGVVAVPPARSLGPLKNAAFSFMHRKEIVKGRNIVMYGDLIVRRGHVEAAPYTPRTAVYLHSGGTSGEPKVIELSDAAVNALASRAPHILAFMDRIEGTAMLAVLPMFHGFGLAMGVHTPLVNGAVSVLMPKFSTKETIALLEKGRLDYLIGVPALYEALLRRPDFTKDKLKHIKIAFIGGDCVTPDLLNRFDTRIRENGGTARLFEGYGLTETVTVCNVNLFSANRPGSVGRPLPGLICKIVDEAGNELDPHETGEILIGGDTLMTGYLGDEAATRAAFTERDGVRYVRTGDAGYVDEDGFLYFKQRLKRIIKIAGVSVYPSEIEAAAVAMDGIAEACALEGQDGGKTVVELYLTAETSCGPDGDAVREHIRQSLGPYAVPRKVVYLDELPKTLVGKADVNALKALVQKNDVHKA